ncbi:acyl transferase/acyl hydrolase/lysophospholipase, partial [Clohesyomyces aquaticus]
KSICNRALESFLNYNQPCAYVDSETGQKCVNTKSGHAIGHQSEGGALLADGGFVDGTFNSAAFIGTINNTVSTVLGLINENIESNREARRSYATNRYRKLLKAIRDPSLWNMLQNPVSDPSFWNTIFREGSIPEKNSLCGQMIDFSCSERTGVCFACLFGRPEYTLPCGHVICFSCIREFDQSSSSEKYPGVAIHKECLLCPPQENRKGAWPYYIEYHPDLSGIRALSLDGGGVRGIMPLTMLRRLEETMDLDVPFNELFDIMIGTSAGGLIALGLGSHGLSAGECISRFKTFCDTGFEHNFLTKTAGIGHVARWLRSSTYKTNPLEDALKKMFGSRTFFGRSGNVARVAVTTIVGTDVKLLANYNWGVGTIYLDSIIDTWLAARCTSAAPSYFEPASLHGLECTDGGLQENNPIQLAVTESEKIFGEDAIFDLMLSLGCGIGEEPPDRSKWFGPGWWKALWGNFNRTMDGEAAWNKFKTNNNANKTLLDRCVRLNIKQEKGKEPGLDDTSAVKALQNSAQLANFYSSLSETQFGPIVGLFSGSSIDILADRLKASLYFFELQSVVQQGDVAIVKGWICCRLHPSAKHAYRTLLGGTAHFEVKGSTQEVPDIRDGERLRLKVDFQQQDSQASEPIRIDVRFERRKDFGVSISGFPVTLRV